MCDPASLTVGMAGGQALQGIMGFMAQRQDAAAAKKFNKELAKNSKLAYLDSVVQIDTRLDEDAVSAAKDLGQADIERRKAQSAARVSAAEAGVAGLSIDALMNDYLRTEANHKDTVMQGLEWERRQGVWDRKSAWTSAKNGFTQNAKEVRKPSILKTALGIGIDVGTSIAGSPDGGAGLFSMLGMGARK